MSFDPKAAGYTTLFIQTGGQVMLPEELTRKWWDKKKQTLAKTHATGIGDLLDGLKPVFLRLTWPRLGGSSAHIESDIEICKKFITSSDVNNYRNKLKEIRDTAVTEAKVFAKSSLTKKTAETLKEMSDTADFLYIACNGSSMGTQLTDAIKAAEKDLKQKAVRLLGPTLNSIKLVINKTPGEINDIKSKLATFQSNPEAPNARGNLGNAIRDLCRDHTQPIGNLMKAAKAGAALTGYDESAVTKLYNAMVKISNTKSSGEFMDKLNGNQAAGLVKLLEGWTKEFKTLCGDVTAGADI